MNLIEDAFNDKPLVLVKERYFVLNPLTEQIPAASSELLREAATRVLAVADLAGVNKIVGEEDRGGVLVAAASLQSNLPFGLARWNPSGVPGQVTVDFLMAYNEGKLYLNGIEPKDKVLIVDDLVSTGGTLISLIRGILNIGAYIQDIVCVAELVEYGGVARVKAETSFSVKTIVKVSVAGAKSRVIRM